MLDVTDEARQAYEDLTIGWIPLEETGEPSKIPEPASPPVQADEIAEHPVSQAYRSMFWSFDVDPTKRRPAGEALARRAASGGLPEIHPLVDAYNQASAATLVALSAFDRHSLRGPLRLDLPREGDQLDAIGEERPLEVTGRHPVWRDEGGPIGLACYRDGERTAIGEGTSRALVVTLIPDGVPGRVADRAFEELETRAEAAGWRFEQRPSSIRI